MNNISHVQVFYGSEGDPMLYSAYGRLDGKPFVAHQYRDYHAARGAEPHRWRVIGDMPQGVKNAVARRINWLMDHCRFCRHEYNATECYHCKFDGGPCRRKGVCKTFVGPRRTER